MLTLTEALLKTFRQEDEAPGLRMLLWHAPGIKIRTDGTETTYEIDAGQRIVHNKATRSYTFQWPGGSATFRESSRPLLPWPDAGTVKAYALHRLGREADPQEWEAWILR